MQEAALVDGVNLLRLLHCTEQQACAHELDRETLGAHLRELHALYRRVDIGSAVDVLSAVEVDDCRRRIRLLDEVRERLAFDLPVGSGRAGLLAPTRAAPDSIPPAADETPRGMEQHPASSLPGATGSSAGDEDAGKPAELRRRAGKPVARETGVAERAQLDQQRRVHDALLSDTAEMVVRLKHNSLLAQRSLASDNATLDLTEAAASSNVSKVDAEARRIQATRRAMRAACCTQWLIGLLVVALFFATLVFIRLVPAPAPHR